MKNLEDRENIRHGIRKDFGGEEVRKLETILKDELLSKGSSSVDNQLADKPYTAEERIQGIYKKIAEEFERIYTQTKAVLGEESEVVRDLSKQLQKLKDNLELDGNNGQRINDQVKEEFGSGLVSSVGLKDVIDDPLAALRNSAKTVQRDREARTLKSKRSSSEKSRSKACYRSEI